MLRALPLALVACVALLLAAAGPAAADRHCKAIRYAGASYPVWVTSGNTGCSTARKTLLRYMKTKRSPTHWVCFRGVGFAAFAASCARRPGTGKPAIIRAYPPGFKTG